MLSMPDKNLPTEWVQPMSEADRDRIERKEYLIRPRKEVNEWDKIEFMIKEMNHGYEYPNDPGMTDTGTIKKWKSRKV